MAGLLDGAPYPFTVLAVATRVAAREPPPFPQEREHPMTASSPVAASSELFRRDDDHGVVTLTLNTPHNLNALSLAMIEALVAELDAIANDETARVVVFDRRRIGAQRRS